MLSFGSIAFLSPYALFALAAVPIIWWLLRFTPPKPDQVRFPPIRFLLGLVSREETPHKSPWWLTALRTLLAVLVILAAANPVLNPHEDLTKTNGPLLVVVDDGWAAADGWNLRVTALRRLADEVERSGRQVILATTSPRSEAEAPVAAEPSAFKDKVEVLAPQPFNPERMALATQLESATASLSGLEVLWLTDGLDYGKASEFAAALTELGGGAEVSVLSPDPLNTAIAIGTPEVSDGGIDVVVRRAATGSAVTGKIRALALNGRLLSDTEFAFESADAEASARFELPVALRNQIARLEVVDARTAGAVYLVDDRWRRKTVGIISGEAQEISQPLLSALYYLQRAVEPFADVKLPQAEEAEAGAEGLLAKGLSVLVMADIGHVLPRDLEAIEKWVDEGGIVIRFAGPRLAGGTDELVPVKLRRGGRALGGALSWSEPQPLSAFESTSPFFGLKISSDINVKRQVLAEPSPELADRTWARLADGTPLVTASKSGNGLIVLFHVPANPEWSNLPMSGLFVEMLQRIVELSQGTAQGDGSVPSAGAATAAAYTPMRTLDGFGAMVDPPPAAAPIAAENIAKVDPQPQHPPGLYRRGGHSYALNLAKTNASLTVLPDLPSGVGTIAYQTAPEEPVRGILLVIAVLLLLLDGLAVLALSGRLGLTWSRGATAGFVLAAALALMPAPHAMAQDAATPGDAAAEEQTPAEDSAALRFAERASLDTRLGYVITGNSTVDSVSLSGLTGLSNILRDRTALEPGSPIGVNLERDEIVFFPLIYWPVTPNAQAPSEKVAAKIDAYLKNGGTIFFDTRDHQLSLPNLTADDASPSQKALRRLLFNLDVPSLEIVPADHVLTKAFYLLQSFPGRWAGGRLWVEASQSDDAAQRRRGSSNFDGVSSIIIGSNDYAAAWATDGRGKSLYPVVPGGPRQRELAYRTGINIVMYALTGNYKADQVHVPALLERLGQ